MRSKAASPVLDRLGEALKASVTGIPKLAPTEVQKAYIEGLYRAGLNVERDPLTGALFVPKGLKPSYGQRGRAFLHTLKGRKGPALLLSLGGYGLYRFLKPKKHEVQTYY